MHINFELTKPKTTTFPCIGMPQSNFNASFTLPVVFVCARVCGILAWLSVLRWQIIVMRKTTQLFITYLFTDLQYFLSLFHSLKPVQMVGEHRKQYKTEGSDVLFTCQHGPNECYGNKVHACAIQHIQVRINICYH